MMRTSTSIPSLSKGASSNALSTIVGSMPMPGLARTGSNSGVLYDFMKSKRAPGPPATIELDTVEFRMFVTRTLKAHLNDCTCATPDNDAKEYLATLQEQVKSLCKHASTQGHRLCSFQAQKSCIQCSKNHLGEIAFSLLSIIQMTPSLPPCVTAKAHSFLGLLEQKQGNLKGAIKAFLKALWIQSSMGPGKCMGDGQDQKNVALLAQEKACNLALTRHRLGVCYGKSGNFAEAITQLDYALADYEISQAGTDIHKKLIEQAQNELTMFEEANAIEVNLPGSTKKLCVSQQRKRHSDPLAVAAGLKNAIATVTDKDEGSDDDITGTTISMKKTYTAPALAGRQSWSRSFTNLSTSFANSMSLTSDSSNFRWSTTADSAPKSPGKSPGRKSKTRRTRRHNSNPFLSKLGASLAGPSGFHPDAVISGDLEVSDLSMPPPAPVDTIAKSTGSREGRKATNIYLIP